MAPKLRDLTNSTALSGSFAGDSAQSASRTPTHSSPTVCIADDRAVAVRYVSTQTAAVILGLKPQTLAKWRLSGRGPPYAKLNGAVRYALPDLLAFAEAGRRLSTSDPGPLDARTGSQ